MSGRLAPVSERLDGGSKTSLSLFPSAPVSAWSSSVWLKHRSCCRTLGRLVDRAVSSGQGKPSSISKLTLILTSTSAQAAGNKFRMTLGLPVGAVMNCADNSGAKNLYVRTAYMSCWCHLVPFQVKASW